FAREHPQPPAMARFAHFFHEYRPPRLVRLMMPRRPVALPQGPVDRLQQRFQRLESAGDGSRRQFQTMPAQLFDGPLDRSLSAELLQEQMHPQAEAIAALGNQLGRPRSRERPRAGAIASATIAAAIPAAKDLYLHFHLLGIF